MAAPNEGTGTTISKYIARFRQEKPRPREARKDARREDFWWVRSRPERDGAAMDWELELLSETSAESESYAGPQRGPLGVEDAALSPSWSLPSVVDVESPLGSKLTIPASPVPSTESVGRVASPSMLAERELYEREALEYEDFVVLPDDCQANKDKFTEERNADGKALLEASLEDPEMVIQRIRRRLGYQQMPPPLPSLALSPVGDERIHVSNVSNSNYSEEEDDMPPLHGEPYPTIALLRYQENATPIVTSSFSCVTHHDDDFEPKIVDLRAAPPSIAEPRPESDNDETESKVDEPPKDKNPLCDVPTERASFAASQDEENERYTQDINDAESFTSFDDWKLKESEHNPSKDSQDFTQGERQDHNITLPATEGEPREKRSPRLPPLSPARSPHFMLATPPRSIQKSYDPEIPVETSQTLDHLLSFVVHSWGENSLSSDDLKDEHERPSPPDEVENSSAFSTLVKLTDGEGDHHHEDAHCDLKNKEEHRDNDQDTGFNDDPIVTVLRNRIAMFEEALQRLDDAQSTP